MLKFTETSTHPTAHKNLIPFGLYYKMLMAQINPLLVLRCVVKIVLTRCSKKIAPPTFATVHYAAGEPMASHFHKFKSHHTALVMANQPPK